LGHILKDVVWVIDRKQCQRDGADGGADKLILMVGELLRLQKERVHIQVCIIKQIDQVGHL